MKTATPNTSSMSSGGFGGTNLASGRSEQAQKALFHAFIADTTICVLVLLQWILFWFINAYEKIELMGVTITPEASLPKQWYTWIGLLSWLTLGGIAGYNIVIEKKKSEKPMITFIGRIAGHSLYYIYAIICLIDIVWKLSGMEGFSGSFKFGIYLFYIVFVLSAFGLGWPIYKGMNKSLEMKQTQGGKI